MAKLVRSNINRFSLWGGFQNNADTHNTVGSSPAPHPVLLLGAFSVFCRHFSCGIMYSENQIMEACKIRGASSVP